MKSFLIFLLLCSFNAPAQKLKIGVLAPDGSSWANSMKAMAQEIETATKSEVSFKVYYGGVAGDESDVLRKIRIGQFQGGFFTGKTLGEISKNIRGIEIPFNFVANRDKAYKALTESNSYFTESLNKSGFHSLGFFELGQVYLVSTKLIKDIDALKGVKIWSWEGDQLVKSMMETLNLVSIPLAIPDVLSSFSTGIIEAAYAPPMGILALQWQTKIKYLVNYPIAYSVGSIIIDSKVWSKVSKDNQNKINTIAKKYVDLINKSTIKENEQALNLIKKSGVTFVDFPQSDLAKTQTIRANVLKKIEDVVISKESINFFNKKI